MFEWLPARIEQARRVFQEYSLDWTFNLNSPATEEEIRVCEAALGVPLPPSYRNFLLQYNGGRLFCFDQEEMLDDSAWDSPRLIIQGTDNLIEFNQQQKEMFTDQEWNSLIAFCDLECMGSGDFCGFDPQQALNSEYAVLDCMHELTPLEWQQTRIATSFAEWLERIFSQVVDHRKQPEYWLEIEASSSLAEETPAALIRQAVKKIQTKDYAGAFSDLDQIIRLDPKYHKAYYEQGNLYFALGEYQAAIESYTQAIDLKPDLYLIAYYRNRGLARVHLKDYQGAITDFSHAIQINPGMGEIYQQRGDTRSLVGDNKGAMEDYQKAASLCTEEETTYSWSEHEDTTEVLEEFLEE